MSYGRAFKNIKADVVEATKRILPGIWQGSHEERLAFAESWIREVSLCYGIEAPVLLYRDQQVDQSGGGNYVPEDHRITLFNKISFVTLLHEFRHAMQFRMEVRLHHLDREEDARGWSQSLFRLAAPVSYRKAVENGLIMHQ